MIVNRILNPWEVCNFYRLKRNQLYTDQQKIVVESFEINLP